MNRFKLNWRVYFFLIFFSFVVLLGSYEIFMLLDGQITHEDGEKIAKGFSIFLALLLGAVLSTYFITVFNLLKQVILFKRTMLTITNRGIENTLVVINLFAIVLVFPVKLIPWESVKYYDTVDGYPYIRLRTKEIKSGRLAKIILAVSGFNFCTVFAKPRVTPEDVLQYQHKFKLK